MATNTSNPRLVLLATSHRVAPGVLTWRAWDALRSADRVLAGSVDHPQLVPVRDAGVRVDLLDDADPHALATGLLRAAAAGLVVWLADPTGDEELMRAVGSTVLELDAPPEVEVVYGSYDLPGARLLDLVSVMDTLRRECPWDREQTHASLAPHLIEEAYEALETIEDGDVVALREELGDVLLQVVFHARVAEERSDFAIDDVAAGIVDKLLRRHPHVFGDVAVGGAEDVAANWDSIKAVERAEKNDGDGGSALDGVPMGQPALALAAQLQRRAVRAGAPTELFGDGDTVGAELFALVRRAQAAGLDPEAELRTVARNFRARVREWEADSLGPCDPPSVASPYAE